MNFKQFQQISDRQLGRMYTCGRGIGLATFLLFLGMVSADQQASAQSVLPPPPISPKVDANGIDVQTGNEMWSFPELSIGPDGIMGLQLVKSGSGGAIRDTFTGSYNYGYSVGVTDWISSTFGNYSSSQGAGKLMNYTPPAASYTTEDGSVVSFGTLYQEIQDIFFSYYDVTYFPDSITYPNGVRWDIHYKSIPLPCSGCTVITNDVRIQSVTSNTGYQIKFLYLTDTMLPGNSNAGDWKFRTGAIAINNAVEYCDPYADACSLSNSWPQASYSDYFTDSDGALAHTVTDAAGGVTQYAFKAQAGNSSQPAGPLYFKIMRPGSSSYDVTYNYSYARGNCNQWMNCQYGAEWRVGSVVTPEKTTSYSYTQVGSVFRITATEPDATSNIYEMPVTWPTNDYTDYYLGLEKWTDRLGRVMTFENNFRGKPTKAVWPEGNYTLYDRNENKCGGIESEVVHPKSGSGTISQNIAFESHGTNFKLCGKPTSVTDPRGNVTEYTYDSSHGGVLTETGPADANGVRPAKKHYYEQRYALVKNSSGAFVQKATPVWLLTETRSCRTSTLDLSAGTCSAGGSDLVRTTFDYGPTSGSGNNLSLRGKVEDAGGLALRTCYGYDNNGRKMSESAPRAGLTSCP